MAENQTWQSSRALGEHCQARDVILGVSCAVIPVGPIQLSIFYDTMTLGLGKLILESMQLKKEMSHKEKATI